MFSALFFFHQCNFGSASTSCHITVVIKREKNFRNSLHSSLSFHLGVFKKKKEKVKELKHSSIPFIIGITINQDQ